MFETILTTKTYQRPLILNLRRTARPVKSLQVKAFEVDGYGDYDAELIGELLAAAPAPQSQITADVTPEEFEKIYQWFLS